MGHIGQPGGVRIFSEHQCLVPWNMFQNGESKVKFVGWKNNKFFPPGKKTVEIDSAMGLGRDQRIIFLVSELENSNQQLHILKQLV